MIMITRIFQLATLFFSIAAICLGLTLIPKQVDKIKKELNEARTQMEASNNKLADAKKDFLTIEASKGNERRAQELVKKTQGLITETQELLAKKETLLKESSQEANSLRGINEKLSADLKFLTVQNNALRTIILDARASAFSAADRAAPSKPPLSLGGPAVTISPPSAIQGK